MKKVCLYVSFTYTFYRKNRIFTQSGRHKKEALKNIENELRQAHTARMAYINAPNYQASLTRADDGGISFKYTLDGEPADVKNNPITPKHITNLLENFYRMDKIGFYHRDLTSEHIFYAKMGKYKLIHSALQANSKI